MCNFSITNTSVHAGDVQGQRSADSAQVHKLEITSLIFMVTDKTTLLWEYLLYERNKYMHPSTPEKMHDFPTDAKKKNFFYKWMVGPF